MSVDGVLDGRDLLFLLLLLLVVKVNHSFLCSGIRNYNVPLRVCLQDQSLFVVTRFDVKSTNVLVKVTSCSEKINKINVSLKSGSSFNGLSSRRG